MVPAAFAQSFDTIEIAVLKTRECVSRSEGLGGLTHLVDNALSCLSELRQGTPAVPPSAAQQFYTLQFNLSQIFSALSSPPYQLCLHHNLPATAGTAQASSPAAAAAAVVKPVSVPPSTGRPSNRCTNPSCATGRQALLKCSRCQAAYYCCQDCQKADWRIHRTICKEIAAKKAAVVPLPSVSLPPSPQPTVGIPAVPASPPSLSDACACSTLEAASAPGVVRITIRPSLPASSFPLASASALDEATFFALAQELLQPAVRAH